MTDKISIYIHWPFCKSKCPYCDFNSHVRDKIDMKDWKQGYLNEIEANRSYIENKKVTSIFFGGGTPSLMPSEIFAAILDKIAVIAKIEKDTEITFEANPTSVEIQKFKEFLEAGANRVSIGIQSFNSENLKFLGREHSKNEAIEAIEVARKYYKRYSFDLIYALPLQSLGFWENELKEGLKYADKHLSLYQLTIEKGTKFYGSWKKKKFILPSEELSRDFYTLTQDIMSDVGLPSYEISNHAEIGEECKHNLAYWQYDEFVGIGPGAHSRINELAITAIYNPENWLESALNNKATAQDISRLTLEEKLEEALLMGLRLSKGIDSENFKKKTGINFSDLNQKKLEFLINNKYLELNQHGLKATNTGRLVLNHIISELIPT